MHRVDIFPGPSWLVTTSGYRTPSRPGHRGVDKGTPDHAKHSIHGAPIYAPWDGTVTTGTESGAGNFIWVTHADGSLFKAFHLSSFVVRSGPVKAGQHIGNTGNTGASQGAHNHWELWEKGRDIDPTAYFDDAQRNGRFAGTTQPVPPPEEDDVTKEELQQELLNQDARAAASFGIIAAKLDQITEQLEGNSVEAPTVKDKIERIYNAVGAKP